MDVLTISALTTHIRALFESDDTLRDVWVLGEVSNWKPAASGHVYFVLKDSGASIGAVMWRNSAAGQSWLPRDGDQVQAHGYVSLYPERGQYQIYVNQIRPAGRGQLYAAFEALKARLAQEGLFDPERKRPIPMAPRRIGIVTSTGTAALRDMLRVASLRWPLVEVVVFPTLVQGNEAPAQIRAAITSANHYSQAVEALDVLIVARGGGSIEDLWCFNDEGVVRAIAGSDLPVVTGVGHETDFTLADFASDLRAATPTAAAAACTPDGSEVEHRMREVAAGLTQVTLSAIGDRAAHLDQRLLRLRRLNPSRGIDVQRQRLDERLRRLQRAAARSLVLRAQRVSASSLRLTALNPQRVLERGYSIVTGDDGRVVTDPAVVAINELVSIRAAGGTWRARRVNE